MQEIHKSGGKNINPQPIKLGKGDSHYSVFPGEISAQKKIINSLILTRFWCTLRFSWTGFSWTRENTLGKTEMLVFFHILGNLGFPFFPPLVLFCWENNSVISVILLPETYSDPTVSRTQSDSLELAVTNRETVCKRGFDSRGLTSVVAVLI